MSAVSAGGACWGGEYLGLFKAANAKPAATALYVRAQAKFAGILASPQIVFASYFGDVVCSSVPAPEAQDPETSLSSPRLLRVRLSGAGGCTRQLSKRQVATDSYSTATPAALPSPFRIRL